MEPRPYQECECFCGMLDVSNLSVTYGIGPSAVHALGPISLSLAKGDICAVIGPSGCGKSTLLHALCGILAPSGGSVTLCGRAVDPRQNSIGFIPQDFGLLAWRTVRQNCLLPLRIRKKPVDGDVLLRMGGIAGRLGIGELMDRYPGEMSGGQKQRAAVARSFLMEPDLLLMDEPFSALDALTREQAQDLFLDIWGQYRTTTVFVTHSIEEAARMGRRILVMSHGPGTVVELIDNPHFGMTAQREREEFHALTSHIRGVVNRTWGMV